jgi:hypothetical protein
MGSVGEGGDKEGKEFDEGHSMGSWGMNFESSGLVERVKFWE